MKTTGLNPDLWQGIQPSIDGTHGAYVQIWADAAALEVINNGTEVPDGGTIVRVRFENESGSPVGESGHALTAMQKIDGYDPDNQLFWVRFDGQTEKWIALRVLCLCALDAMPQTPTVTTFRNH